MNTNKSEKYMQVLLEIYRAIHEGYMLRLDYVDPNGNPGTFYIAISGLENRLKRLWADVYSASMTYVGRKTILVDNIQSAKPCYELFAQVDKKLIDDVNNNRYDNIFPVTTTPNLNVLDYLKSCYEHSQLENVKKEDLFSLYSVDEHTIKSSETSYDLNDDQNSILKEKLGYSDSSKYVPKKMEMNLLGLDLNDELYSLISRELQYDPKQKRIYFGNVKIRHEGGRSSRGENAMDLPGLLEFIPVNEVDNENYALQHLKEIGKELEAWLASEAEEHGYEPCNINTFPSIYVSSTVFSVPLGYEYGKIREAYKNGQKNPALNAFFGVKWPEPSATPLRELYFYDKKPNESQFKAIQMIDQNTVTYVQGPPGTGKTQMIVNSIVSGFLNGDSILVCSNNNKAIDDICNKIFDLELGNGMIFPALRIGSKAHRKEALLKIRDTYQWLETDKGRLVQEDATLQKMADKTYSGYLALKSNNELKQIVDNLGQKRKTVTKEILELFDTYLQSETNMLKLEKAFPIIACTNYSTYLMGANSPIFDLVIMDEACACGPALALMPLRRGKRVALVGDPMQLEPVARLNQREEREYRKKYDVLERYNYCNNSIYQICRKSEWDVTHTELKEHYRCRELIAQFFNEHYYGGTLKCMRKKNSVDEVMMTAKYGSALEAVLLKDDYSNTRHVAKGEAEAIVQYVLEHPNWDIGVITPFKHQAKYIKQKLNEKANDLQNEDLKKISCNTVHSFQGDEKDVILFSMDIPEVNDKAVFSQGTYDWINDTKAIINVGVSRAKNKLVIFACPKAVQKYHEAYIDNRKRQEKKDYISLLLEYISENGNVDEIDGYTEKEDIQRRELTTTERACEQTLKQIVSIYKPGFFKVKHQVLLENIVPKSNWPKEDRKRSFSIDFLIVTTKGKVVLVIELDGKEHIERDQRKEDDEKKEEILEKAGIPIVRIQNKDASNYEKIKPILETELRKTGEKK